MNSGLPDRIRSCRFEGKEVIYMAQIKEFKAKKPFKLDCGHGVRVGDSFVVMKVFTCEMDARRVPYSKVEAASPQK
jgi:hypothetical protein